MKISNRTSSILFEKIIQAGIQCMEPVIVASKCTSFGLLGWSRDLNTFGRSLGLVLFCCGAGLNGGSVR